MQKKIIAIIMTVFMILVIGGCGNSDSTSSSSTDATADKKTITLKEGWVMNDAISADEVGAIVGETVQSFPEASSDAAHGKPSGSFTIAGKTNSKIAFSVDVNGGAKAYELKKSYAVKDSVKDLSGIGDKAYICDLSNGVCSLSVQKGETVIRVEFDPSVYNKASKEDLGKQLISKLMNNMYK